MDLGKAIAINPSNAGNYFLRGDCHCKLGDYEQALMDYDYAESKGFEDMCALYLSRGSVRRLLHDISGALSDFSAVYKLISSGDRVRPISPASEPGENSDMHRPNGVLSLLSFSREPISLICLDGERWCAMSWNG